MSAPVTPQAAPAVGRRFTLPTGPALVAIAYAVCVLGLDVLLALSILWSEEAPLSKEGAVSSMIGVTGIGTAALVVATGLTLALRRTPGSTRAGAVVMGVLSLLGLVVFWSGTPALFGAGAAWLGGLTRGSEPQSGAARAFGIVGIFVVALDMVLNIGGALVDMVQHL